MFKLTPPAAGQTAWTETVLYSFIGGTTDGANPFADLIAGEEGALYGITLAGGSSGYGTVFRQCSVEERSIFGGKGDLRCVRW